MEKEQAFPVQTEDERNDDNPRYREEAPKGRLLNRKGWFAKADGLSKSDQADTKLTIQEAARKHLYQKFLKSKSVEDRVAFGRLPESEKTRLFEEWRKDPDAGQDGPRFGSRP